MRSVSPKLFFSYFELFNGYFTVSVLRLTGPKTSQWYFDTLRMVVYEDYATGNVYRFLINDFTHSYLAIAELFREHC